MPTNVQTPEVTNLLISDGEAEQLRAVPIEELGWSEREDLQVWVRTHPDVIEPDLLLISEEFADWEGARAPVRDRLDLLFLDAEGRAVVVELKKGVAPDRSESQALMYAAYCDKLTTSDLVDLYARTKNIGTEEAHEAVTTHVPALAQDQPGPVRVRLVAEDFPPSVTTTILFLRELGSGAPDSPQLDIGCIKLTAYRLPDGSHVVSAQPIIPVPGTEAYQVSRRRRQAGDETSRQKRARVAMAVPTLQREGAIASGAKLKVNLAWFSGRDREAVQVLIDREPAWTTAEWTGETNIKRAVLHECGEEPVSLDAAYQAMREAAGLGTAPGATNAWLVEETDKTVRELADEVLARANGVA